MRRDEIRQACKVTDLHDRNANSSALNILKSYFHFFIFTFVTPRCKSIYCKLQYLYLLAVGLSLAFCRNFYFCFVKNAAQRFLGFVYKLLLFNFRSDYEIIDYSFNNYRIIVTIIFIFLILSQSNSMALISSAYIWIK